MKPPVQNLAGRPSTAPAPEAPGEDLTLRNAVPDDVLCLSVLAMQVFLDTYATRGIRTAIAREALAAGSQPAFAEAIGDARARIVVAECHGHMVGFAQVTLGSVHALAPQGAPAELLRLYVQEPFTGRQAGTALLAAAETVAAVAGASVMWLTSWVHNHRALAFYARRGYADFGRTAFTFEGESHPNRVLARRLDTPAS